MTDKLFYETTPSCSECSLKNFSVFKDCSEDLLNKVFSHKRPENLFKGDFLIKQDEEFKGVFCIQQGVVKVTRSGKKHKGFILRFARPGDVIGLDSFINNENYSYSARAVDNVCTCFIPAADFQSILSKDPALSIGLMKDLCEKINFIEDRITSMARKKIREQFAEMLISLAVKNKKSSEEVVAINYSVKDLANIIGTTKNYLYKILSDFTDKKLVSIHNRKLVINNFDRLSLVAIGNESANQIGN